MRGQDPMDAKKPLKKSVVTDSDSSSDSSQRLHKSWLDLFFEQPSSTWFARVPEAFTADGFNTSGLLVDPTHAKSALNQLLEVDSDDESYSSFDSDSEDEVEQCTQIMFGLLHARYIFSAEGIRVMIAKYLEGQFGKCPRVRCKGAHLLPIGLTDKPGVEGVKRFCPCCKQIYKADPIHEAIDGAYFGTSFPHYLLLELKLST